MGWWNKLIRDKTEKEKEKKREVIKEALKGKDQEKALANLDNEPWVKVLNVDVNPENISQGFFELDWNEAFVEMLAQNGYTGATPEEIVDAWFTDLCRGIARTVNSDGFVVDEDVIRLSDLQKAENNKKKK